MTAIAWTQEKAAPRLRGVALYAFAVDEFTNQHAYTAKDKRQHIEDTPQTQEYQPEDTCKYQICKDKYLHINLAFVYSKLRKFIVILA